MYAGLRQSAQTFGAIVGATIAAATFRLSGSNYIATFALSAIPAAVALLVVTVVGSSPSLLNETSKDLKQGQQIRIGTSFGFDGALLRSKRQQLLRAVGHPGNLVVTMVSTMQAGLQK